MVFSPMRTRLRSIDWMLLLLLLLLLLPLPLLGFKKGLPFSAPAENPGTEGGFDFSSPPSTLFALCAAASSTCVGVR